MKNKDNSKLQNVLAVGIMRQANFPDRKALTARDETNSEPNQPQWAGPLKNSGYCSAWAVQGQRKHWAENIPFSLNLPLTPHILATLITALVKQHGRQVSSSSELSFPYAKLPYGWSRLSIFPESHLPHIFIRWPWPFISRPLPD